MNACSPPDNKWQAKNSSQKTRHPKQGVTLKLEPLTTQQKMKEMRPRVRARGLVGRLRDRMRGRHSTLAAIEHHSAQAHGEQWTSPPHQPVGNHSLSASCFPQQGLRATNTVGRLPPMEITSSPPSQIGSVSERETDLESPYQSSMATASNHWDRRALGLLRHHHWSNEDQGIVCESATQAPLTPSDPLQNDEICGTGTRPPADDCFGNSSISINFSNTSMKEPGSDDFSLQDCLLFNDALLRRSYVVDEDYCDEYDDDTDSFVRLESLSGSPFGSVSRRPSHLSLRVSHSEDCENDEIQFWYRSSHLPVSRRYDLWLVDDEENMKDIC